MKRLLRDCFLAALRDLDVGAAMAGAVRRDGGVLQLGPHAVRLPPGRRVLVVAIGKAALPMAQALLPRLDGSRVTGLVVAPTGADGAAAVPLLEVIPARHPLPDAGSLAAADRALSLLATARDDDIVLFLLSGGASALCERPLLASIPFADMVDLHRLLVGCGADIVAMNTVRKHFSAVKGGRLAVAAGAIEQCTLLLSDVPKGQDHAIGSGPSLPDPGCRQDLDAVLDRHRLRERLPASLREALASGAIPPLPARDDPAFARSRHHVVLDNTAAVAAMQRALARAGVPNEVVATSDASTADELAEQLLAALRELRSRHATGRVAVVAGGELSVVLPAAPGIGGRNQQFVLAVARRIEGQAIAVLGAGTDGRDGSAPAAGAVADGATATRARAIGLDLAAAFARCDAHPVFDRLGDTVVTAAGNNLRDVRVLIAE